MLSLTVDLRVKPGHLEEFLDAISVNAQRSFQDEEGCVYFDVSQDVDDELHFNADQAALDAHRCAPHFYVWREAVAKHVVPGSQKNMVGTRMLHHG